MSQKVHSSNADRQRAYRARQRAQLQQLQPAPVLEAAQPLPFHGPEERAQLRAVLLEAAELLEKATPKKPRGKRAGGLMEIFDSPQEQQQRKARAVRELVDALAL